MVSFSVLSSAACLLMASASATTTIGSVYGYGTGINGFPLFYADGVAYLGHGRPEHASTSTNVTCTSGFCLLPDYADSFQSSGIPLGRR